MAFSKNWKPVPYREGELKRFEYAPGEREEMEREQDEQAAREAKLTATWTANNGTKIAVRYIPEIGEYEVTMNNGLPKKVVAISPVKNVPGVVAKLDCIGISIGLTAERKAAVEALAK